MDDLISDFIAETREMLEALGGEIVAWESDPHDRARLDAIFRFVHTVKGNSGFFDLPRLQSLSHAAEDVLAEVRAGKRSADHRLVSAVLAVIDRIGELVQALETGETLVSEDDEQLIAALKPAAVPEEAHHSGPAGAIASGPRAAVRTIRLSVDLLDRMMSGVSDLVLARNELARHLRETSGSMEVGTAFERVSGTIAELRDAITRTRMQRIENLFTPLPRMVRDLSAELGKEVTLVIDSGDVELDREMIEMIRDPLTHIVRNAIDHGIEPAEERRRAGKPPSGTLRVCACQTGNQILIEVTDDGRGIDGDKLAAKAVVAGILTGAQAERLSAAQKCALVFEPGLSTAGEVTAISGRGVGMDVVRANIERIGGLVDIDSTPGEGLHLTLRVPLTLTIIPALTIRVGGRCFAIPRSAIEEIVRVTGSAVRIEELGGAAIATIRGKRLPLVSLGDALGLEHLAESRDRNLIVLKPGGGDSYALAVDGVSDHEELVVKPAAPAVMATGLYAGTTLADDGSPILLLDTPGVAARAGIELSRAALEEATSEPSQQRRRETPSLLFRGLDGNKRIVPLSAVERIEEVAADAVRRSAGRLHVALGERILPLAGCGDTAPGKPIRVLRLTDGASDLAYALAEVVDMIGLGEDIRPATVPGEVRGVTLVDGEQVEVLDLYWLFETHAASQVSQRPVCVLPIGDPWMETILRPIVESAGYRVVAETDPLAENAAVHIVNADAQQPARALPSAEVVSISSGPREGSIHRYDRAALLSALGRPRASGSGGES